MTRRDMLKNSAMVSVALSSSLSSLQAAGAINEIKFVPHATHFGPFIAKVKDGKFVEVIPSPQDKNPSVMIESMIDRVYTDSRVKYPCVRKGFLEGKNNPHMRGKEPFVRVDWDTALELVAQKIKATPKENIYNAAYGGWGHVGRLHNANSVAGRFFNIVLGGAVGTDGEYSNGAAGRVNSDIIGDMEVYSQQTTHEQIIKHTKVYVMWGADLFKCNRIDYVVPNHLNDTYYPKYKQAGIKFISIDPYYNESAQMFDAQWIKIRPNTDVALMLGMMHYLYTSGKYDKAFIQTYTDGFDKFLPYLLGQSDGVAKDVVWASNITEVSQSQIKELADLFVSQRTFIAGNWAMQRAQYGEQADWGLIALASMIGQIGLPGGGVGFSMHYAGGGQANSGYTTTPGLSQGRNRVSFSIPASRISECILNPGKSINFKGRVITFPEIKMIYCCGATLLGHHPNTNELIRAIRSVDTVVVHEPWWTPMAKMADIVFPSTCTLERDDITSGGTYSRNVIYAMKKVIEPTYEHRDDFEIFADLSKKLGGEELYNRYTGGMTYMEWIEKFYNSSSGVNFKDFETFWKDGFVEFDIDKEAYDYVRHADFRTDPIANKLATQSGKIQFFVDKFQKADLVDFKGHVMWFEPDEYLGSAESKDYPFHLLTPHPRYRVHSQLDNTWVRGMYKIQGREPVMINTQDAAKLGIKHGEVVEVYNKRGSVLAGAFVTDFIREGVVQIQEGAWYDPENPDDDLPRCNAGACNVLTSSRPTSRWAQATSVNTCLVGIRKLGKDEAIKPYKASSAPDIIGA